MNLIEIRDLRKYFATQKAVDGISFDIKQGSIFGLLGPNGAGKTTLIRMLTGIFLPDSGEILMNGKKYNPEKDNVSIGYMPEERGLYKKMKIGEQAVYLARLRGLTKQAAQEAAKEWFTRLDMQTWWNKKVEDLSKGMSQKLQFVSTVLHKPRLIILDEPFSGLDPVNANLIKDEIFRLAAEGSTIIFSTHRMEQVEEICDHIILINKGEKVLDGNINKIKQDFKEHSFLIQTENDHIPEASSLFTTLKQTGTDYRIQLLPGASPNQILRHLLDHNITIRNFNEILPSLESIFIRLVENTGVSRAFQNITS